MQAMDKFWQDIEQTCDSLKNALRTQTLTEREKMDIYYSITGLYAAFSIDSAIVYAPKAIQLSEKLNEQRITMDAYIHWGVALGFRNNYDSALILLDKAQQIAIKLGDKECEINAFIKIAFIYVLQGNYLTAIDYYLKALPVYELMEDYNGLATVLANLAELNRKLNNTEIALQYLDKATKAGEKLKPYPGLYDWKIANIYNEYTTLYLEQNMLDKALEYALKSSNTINGGGVITKCTNQVLLARIYLQSGDYDRALQYAKEAMEQADILKEKFLYLKTWIVLSDIYLAQKRYPEAETEALKAWQADSINIDESRAIALNIALANIHLHNETKAEHYLKKYTEINEQYSKKSFHTTISDMTVKYETKKKEMHIADLERQNILYISIGITGLLLAITIGIILRQKVKNEQKEKQLIVANAILEWEKKERKRFANDLHDGINGMLSAIKLELNTKGDWQNVRNQIDDCIETIRRMARGMTPSSLERYGLKAALEDYCRLFPNVDFYFFGEDKRIDEKLELAVYYCAYELVNNSFKHSGAKNINVQLVQDDSSISLTVQDDGYGFDEQSLAEVSGLKNIRDRIAAFNGKIDIETSPDKGTETNIELNT
jgi:signal transduction histidine kinase